MSSAAAWSYTATATHWAQSSRDGWTGAGAFAAPVQFACDYKAGDGSRVNAAGREYTVKLSIYTERSSIVQGDRVLIGSSTAADPLTAGADEVMDVGRFGDTLDRAADDYVVST